MTNTQAAAQYQGLNLSKVPSVLAPEIEGIKKNTANFTGTDKGSMDDYQNFKELLDLLQNMAPDAFKSNAKLSSTQSTAKKAPKTKAAAKPKAKAAAKKATVKKVAPKPAVRKSTAKKKPKGGTCIVAGGAKKVYTSNTTPKAKPAAKKKVSTRKPAAKKKMKVSVSASAKDNKKKLADIKKWNAEVITIRKRLKSNDKVFTEVNKKVSAYMTKNYAGLADSIDTRHQKAKDRLKLYKRFESNDKARLRNLKKRSGKNTLSGVSKSLSSLKNKISKAIYG